MAGVQSEGEDWTPIALARSRALADECTLVLSAADIAWHVRPQEGMWEVRVARGDAERAAAALTAYGAERQPPPAPAPLPDHPDGTLTAAIVALLLVVFFLAGGLGWWPVAEWTRRGNASASHVMVGEWWRVVTALTLHNDLAHVLGNAVAMAVFGAAVCRWFGPGAGLALIVAAGAGGNALNALLRGGAHRSLGASTAVFGAVGVLAALQLTRRLRSPERGLMRIRTWAPLAAGLGLLALLGSSPDSDVAAHALGFLAGAALGWLAAQARLDRLGAAGQAVLAGAVAMALLACWSLALRA